jgi:hypothetical protein
VGDGVSSESTRCFRGLDRTATRRGSPETGRDPDLDLGAIDAAAEQLNNTRAVRRRSDVDPRGPGEKLGCAGQRTGALITS